MTMSLSMFICAQDRTDGGQALTRSLGTHGHVCPWSHLRIMVHRCPHVRELLECPQ